MTMKDRPKLGRGLKDVSPFFLTATPPDAPSGAEPSPGSGPRTVCVCGPAAAVLQSFFTANLALEMAKDRRRVVAHDFLPDRECGLTALMRSLLSGNDAHGSGERRVRLYGLPDITIRDMDPDGCFTVQEPAAVVPGAAVDATDRILMINANPSLEFILQSAPMDEYLVLTGIDGKALLRSYAYIRAMRARSTAGRIHVVLDAAGTDADPELIFERFSGFLRAHAGLSVGCLGTLMLDEQARRSIQEERPLVLSPDQGASRDALVQACGRFSRTIMETATGAAP